MPISERNQRSIAFKNNMLEKRIDDLKWYVIVFSGSVAFLVAALSLIVGFNLSSEKNSLRDFKNEIRKDISDYFNKSAQPIIDITTINGHQLNEGIVEAIVNKEYDGSQKITFRYALHNTGKGSSGPMFMRFYSNDVILPDPDIDNTEYKYSTFIACDKFNPREILGGASMLYTSNIGVSNDFKFPSKKVTMMVRLYYGNGKMEQRNLILKISR